MPPCVKAGLDAPAAMHLLVGTSASRHVADQRVLAAGEA
jgi:hypothetical protein